jgi:uncharacterized protein YbjT (DUF2867 family)
MFAANARLWWAPKIRAGNVVRWPCAEAPTAPIHERDIAAVAARILGEEGHVGKDYVLTGPQSLSQFEQVGVIGEVIGRSLRVEGINRKKRAVNVGCDASASNTHAAERVGRRNRPACIDYIRSRRYHRNAGADIS